jgi:aminoglycoside/choline kinase family phosphotransferase
VINFCQFNINYIQEPDMQRQQQLTLWLHSQFPDQPFTLAPASADASFRRYFRATFADGQTRIVMDAPPQHEDCRPFLHIAQLFQDAGIHVPYVYAHDLTQGFLLLSDLGNTTYLQALGEGKADTANALYGAATDALIKIQLATQVNELPPYNDAVLLREMRLFPEWYISKHLNVTLSEAQNAKLETVFARIIANNLAQPKVYVHRDYHSRNLMVVDSNRHSPFPPPQPSPDGRGGKRIATRGLFNLAWHSGFSGCALRSDHLRSRLVVQRCLHTLGRGGNNRLAGSLLGKGAQGWPAGG